MRLKLVFQLENNTLDIQYRKSIISWIKHALQQYDENLFQEIYNNNNKKTFTFAPILSKPKFNKKEITMQDNQFSIVFSAYNYIHGLHLYNSFLKQKFQKFSLNKNSMTLTNICMIPENKIIQSSIKVKMSSPLIVRNHNRETLKDLYYGIDKQEFEKYLKINIEEQIKAENLDTSLLQDFKIIPIQAKKIVIPLYEKMIECTVGSFELQGNIELLEYLYKAGMRCEEGHGIRLVRINIRKEEKWNNLKYY